MPPPPIAPAGAPPPPEDSCAAGFNIGIVIAFVVVALIVGFLIGARAKQLVEKVKASANAVITIKELLKAGADDAAGDDGAEEADGEGEEEEEEPAELLEQFMNMQDLRGLDDHADIVRNPIIMYHVKLAKEDARREKRKQQMIAEGMDEEDAERLLLDEAAGMGSSGGGGGGGAQNALATLIAAGARVTAMDDSSSADAAQAEERRRQARTIEAFLQKSRGIDTTKSTASKGGGAHKRSDNALEVAVKTAVTPFGGEKAKRDTEKTELAKRGRNMLRGIHARREKAGLNKQTRGQDVPAERRQGGAQGGLLSAEDQAALLAELTDEEGGEEGGEGEEGEEGYREEGLDEEDKLAA